MATPEILEVMASRQARTWIRPFIAVGIALAFAPLFAFVDLALWLGVVGILHVLEVRWARSSLQASRLGRPVSPRTGLALVFLFNLCFSFMGVTAILSGETWTMICGAVLLAGALLNAGASSGTSLELFLAGSISSAAGCLSLIYVAARSGATARELVALGLAIALLFVALMVMRGVVVSALLAVRAARDSKGAFLANLSHEIRTPLNGILGVAQAMALEDLAPLQRHRLELVQRSGLSLVALLNDVLDLSKVEAGKLELNLGNVDVAQLSRDLVDTFDITARQKGVGVRFDLSPDAGGIWRADPNRLRQILTNLLSNAVKFTAQGEVTLSLASVADGVVLSVSDTGIGIPANRLDAVFSPYAQATSSTASEYGGTGLGLAICRDLAELMGGRLTVDSSLGVGSTFRLLLPAERAQTLPQTTSQDAAGLTDFRGVRVLAAEDHPTNQAVLRLLLEQFGVEVHVVGDGGAAIEAWRQGDWDAVLMDIEMPGIDGPTAARTIRAEERSSKRRPVPIIALTGNILSHQVEAYAACGMNAHVAKPLELQALMETLGSILATPRQGEVGTKQTA